MPPTPTPTPTPPHHTATPHRHTTPPHHTATPHRHTTPPHHTATPHRPGRRRLHRRQRERCQVGAATGRAVAAALPAAGGRRALAAGARGWRLGAGAAGACVQAASIPWPPELPGCCPILPSEPARAPRSPAADRPAATCHPPPGDAAAGQPGIQDAGGGAGAAHLSLGPHQRPCQHLQCSGERRAAPVFPLPCRPLLCAGCAPPWAPPCPAPQPAPNPTPTCAPLQARTSQAVQQAGSGSASGQGEGLQQHMAELLQLAMGVLGFMMYKVSIVSVALSPVEVPALIKQYEKN
jgi:hypothetical protein